MSLSRAALLARQHPIATFVSKCTASTSVHVRHQEHHNEHYDSTQYPKEGFGNPLWRKTALFALVVVGTYKYAPEPAEDVYLTRWIAMYSTPRVLWLDMNAKNTALQMDSSEKNLLFGDAKKPRIHRYRHPQSFENVSPFLTPVGDNVDTSTFVVRSYKD